MKELEEKILEDIERTGFLSELNITKLFISRDWIIAPNETYLDKDLNKSREIDLLVGFGKYYSKLNYTMLVSLVIEIKKDTKRPWVVFSTNKDNLESKTRWAKFITYGNNYTTKDGSIFSVNDPSINFPNENFSRIGRNFHEAFKKPDENSKIYESLISCCKAAHSFGSRGDKPFEKDFNQEDVTHLTLSIPLVVLDGLLYEVYLEEDGQTCLESKDCISLKLNYSSPNYTKNEYGLSEAFWPVIVTEKGLNQYLKDIEMWFKYQEPLFSQTMKTWREGKGQI